MKEGLIYLPHSSEMSREQNFQEANSFCFMVLTGWSLTMLLYLSDNLSIGIALAGRSADVPHECHAGGAVRGAVCQNTKPRLPNSLK